MQERLFGNWDVLNDQHQPLHRVFTFTPEGNWRLTWLATSNMGVIKRSLMDKAASGRYKLTLDDDKWQLALRIYGPQDQGLITKGAMKMLERKIPLTRLANYVGILFAWYTILQVGEDEIKVRKLENGRPVGVEYWRPRRHPM